jgi:putative endonuclease
MEKANKEAQLKETEKGRGKRQRPSKAAPAPQQWSLYVLLCADGSLYCGITTDLVKRLEKHNKGLGARYTRGRGPLTLLRSWPHESMSAALKAEAAFKGLSRRAKDARIAAMD